jgi:voltage-gated potassium channel Kch
LVEDALPPSDSGPSQALCRFSSGRGPPLDLTSLLPAAGAAGGTPPEAKIFGAFYVIFTGVLHALLEHLVTSLVRRVGAAGMAVWRGGPTPGDTSLTLAAFGTASKTIKLGLDAKEMVEIIDVTIGFDIHRLR